MKDELLNCWEIKNCGRERGGRGVSHHGECPVSEKGMGHSCWALAGSFHDGEPYCPQVKDKGGKCTQCDIFNLYCRTGCPSGQEIGERFPDEEERYVQLMAARYNRGTGREG